MGLFSRKKDPAGVAGQAVVVDYAEGRGNRQTLRDSESGAGDKFTAVVHVVGSIAQPQSVTGKLPFHVGWLMLEGDTIAVRIDPVTGAVLDFDRDAMIVQYEPQKPLVKAQRKKETSLRYQLGLDKESIQDARESMSDLAQVPQQWREAVRAPSAPAMPPPPPPAVPGDPNMLPIEGVDFDTWVTVQATLVRQKVKRAQQDLTAQSFGVPAGRWSHVSSAWMARTGSDVHLAHRFQAAYQAALNG